MADRDDGTPPGSARPARRSRAIAPLTLETSLPGMFAAGDVRYNSPKGVAAAVADGATAARSAYEYLNGE